jgi:hypothetical protein
MIAANPKQVEQYRAGKKTMLGFFVGQVMKASKGQANPQCGADTLVRLDSGKESFLEAVSSSKFGIGQPLLIAYSRRRQADKSVRPTTYIPS